MSGSRIRKIPDKMCDDFEDDMAVLKATFQRLFGKYTDMSRNEWLGGDIETGANEAPPPACADAIASLRVALVAVRQADSFVAIHRATQSD